MSHTYGLYQDTVDGSIEPYNLYPATDALMGAENWLLRNIPKNQKIVIILAEEHAITTDVALRQAVLSAHVKQFWHDPQLSFAFGYEQPHNIYAPDIMADNRRLTETFVKMSGLGESKETNQQLFEFCLAHGIQIAFNDIADYQKQNGDHVVDQNDEFTRGIIAEHAPHLLDGPEEIVRESAQSNMTDGLILSNLAIVKNAIRHMEKTQSRIYIQDCGVTHALGDKYHLNYSDSLAQLFRDAGYAVITLIPSLQKFIPNEALENEHIIFSTGLHRTNSQTPDLLQTIDYQSFGLLSNPKNYILPHEKPKRELGLR